MLHAAKTYQPKNNAQKLLLALKKIDNAALEKRAFKQSINPATGERCNSKLRCHNDGKCLWDNLSLEWYCECKPGFYGEKCMQQKCPKDCSSHGDCFQGQCFCRPGWCGNSCSEKCAAHRIKDVLDTAENKPLVQSKNMFNAIDKTVVNDMIKAESDSARQIIEEKKTIRKKVADRSEKDIDEAMSVQSKTN